MGMIRKIAGRLDAVELGQSAAALIEIGSDGLTYEVLLPRYLADRLAADGIGGRIELHTRQYLEAVGQGTSFIPRLIGFATEADRKFFELFTTVKGLGNRRALRAMAQEPAVIAAAIAAKDAKALQRLPEIGKRLAETIIVDLTGKVDGWLGAGEIAGLNLAAAGVEARSRPRAVEAAIDTLLALGETRGDAERMIDRVLATNPADSFDGPDGLVAAAFGVGSESR